MPKYAGGYYPLIELREEDREKFPEGRTFALKRAAIPGETSGFDLKTITSPMRLIVLNAPPEEYVLGYKVLAKNLRAKRVGLELEECDRTNVLGEVAEKGSRRNHHPVIRFGGTVILPNTPGFEAVGAYIPGEQATGYLHALESARAETLFPQTIGQIT